MATITYKGKKLKISEGDLQGIKFALSVGRDQVDVQQPVKRGKSVVYDVVWLQTSEIKL